jgi:hypothetical protein
MTVGELKEILNGQDDGLEILKFEWSAEGWRDIRREEVSLFARQPKQEGLPERWVGII